MSTGRAGTDPRAGLRAVAGRRWVENVALALLAYVPFLCSSPGTLSSDSKQYLYLDPNRFLASAPFLWDSSVGAGTVPHQHLGYMVPMGPWFWIADRIGLPDWVGQRLWLGTVSFVAVLGARWCFTRLRVGRLGALAGALVYMLTPFQLAFTARMSVLLLPWAALPWLVGLTMRATRRGGWRDPALVALVVFAIGGVNASALLLVAVGPALWIVVELFGGRAAARAALGAAGRIGVLTVGVSLWWIVGLMLQGSYGLPVLQLTENVRTITEASTPNDVLRGLGNWFFYGRDRLGFSVDQAADYLHTDWVIVASYAVPCAGLVAASVLRWRYRAYFVALVLVGAVVAVGAWPYDDPSPYGTVWKALAEGWSPLLALRNTPRVAPILVLGFAGLLAAAVGAMPSRRLEVAAAATVGALAFAALGPVWTEGFLTDSVERPNEIPAYWQDAAASLDADGDATRVLEIPGSEFAAYRWGNAVEPVTPGLMDRPYLAREVLPAGTPPLVNLLDALDRTIQRGTFEPDALAPVARLLGVGTVSLRSDLDYERSGTPRPQRVWDELTVPLAAGLEPPDAFGPLIDSSAPVSGHPIDELDLRTVAAPEGPPAVARFDLSEPGSIVRLAPIERPVVVVGDGAGIVDAAGAGLIDGRSLVLELAALDPAAFDAALGAGADLVVTDTNRKRIETWFSSIRDNKGPTERADQTTTELNGYDFRLDVFGDLDPSAQTVVEHVGAEVDATGDGGAARPEDRPVYAFDGDLRTTWRVGGADPTGHTLSAVFDEPVTADRVTLVQPQDGPRDRELTTVRLRFDGGDAVTVELGPESFDPAGQTVTFGSRTIGRLDIELLATTEPGYDPAFANAVGFSEVRIGDVEVDEVVRLPTDLVDRVDDTSDHALDVVLTRLRIDPAMRERQDEELAIDRRVELGDARTFGVAGTVRVNPNVDDSLLDTLLGTSAGGARFSASSHLAGDLQARASRAFDGDRTTRWTSSIGSPEQQWVEVELDENLTIDGLDLALVADGRHSVPTRVRVDVDDHHQFVDLAPIVDAPESGAVTEIPISLEPASGRRIRLTVESTRSGGELPVAIAELGVDGVPRATDAASIEIPCRSDLVEVDGRAIGISVRGDAAAARRGLSLEPCGAAIRLGEGSHHVEVTPGLDTGIDVDRIVLSSGRDGSPGSVGPRGASTSDAPASIVVDERGRTSFDLTASTDGAPFWLVLGQSESAGWDIDADGASVSERTLVDGFANGWVVTPDAAGAITISLRWTPQRIVWPGIVVSALMVIACVVLVARGRRSRQLAGPAGASTATGSSAPTSRRRGPALSMPAVGWVTAVARPTRGRWRSALVLAVGVAVGVAVFSRWWIGVLAGAAAVVSVRIPEARAAIIVAVPALVLWSRVVDDPELAWLALGIFVAEMSGSWLRERDASAIGREDAPAVPSVASRRARSVAEPPRGGVVAWARRNWMVLVLVAAAIAGSLWSQHEIFPALSWNRDEPVYLWQTSALLDGHLTPPDGGFPEAFHPWLSAAVDGELFSQYTPGWPVVMAAADTVVGSTRGAIVAGTVLMVLGTYLLARELTRDRTLALLSAAVLTVSPILAIQGGVYLNYLFTAGLGLCFAAAVLGGVRRRRPWLFVVAGALLGWVFLTRPFDALLWGAVVVGYVGLVHRRAWRDLLTAGAWVALGLVPLVAIGLAYNAHLTGSATTFPITVADPLDKFGFGSRRIMPGFPIVDYTVGEAVRSTAKNTVWLPVFFFGAYLGVLGSAVGLWLRRRERSTLLLLALVVVFPIGYLPFFGTSISAITTKISGPIYFVPLYAPLSIALASALLAAWRRRRALGVAFAVVLVAATLPIARNRFDLNRRLSEAQVPWEDADARLAGGDDPALVFVADTEGYLLFSNPFSRNDAELDGRVLYAVDRGGANLSVIAAYPQRVVYRERASLRSEDLGPIAGGTVPEITVEPLTVVRGARLALDMAVTNPPAVAATAVTVAAGGAQDSTEVAAQRSDLGPPTELRWSISAGGANRIDAAAHRIVLAEGSGELLVTVGYGATAAEARESPAVRQTVPYRVVDSMIEILLPSVAERYFTVEDELQLHPAFDPPELAVSVVPLDGELGAPDDRDVEDAGT